MTLPASEEDRRIISAFVQLVQRRPNCLTCQHFDEPSESCGMAGGARPPARTIAYGCPRYAENPPF